MMQDLTEHKQPGNKQRKKENVYWDANEIKQLAQQTAKRRLNDLNPPLLTLVKGAIAQLPKDRQRELNNVPSYLLDEIKHYIKEEIKSVVPPPPPIKLEELSDTELRIQLELIINRLPASDTLNSIHDCFSADELISKCPTQDLLHHALNRLVDFAGKLDKITRLPGVTEVKPTKPTTTPVNAVTSSEPKPEPASRKPKVGIDGFKPEQIQHIQSAVSDKFTVFGLRKSGKETRQASLDVKDAEVYIVNIKWTQHENYRQIKDHANKTGKLFIEHRGGTSSLIQQLKELKLNV